MMSTGDRRQLPACSLSADELRERTVLIDQLLARGLVGLIPIPGGVRVLFVTGPGLRAELHALVELEARCCASLTLTVADGDGAIVLEVTGSPEAQTLISELFTRRV
jgi:hypothetical protein